MPRGAAQVAETLEAAQIKCSHDLRRTDEPKAMHAHQKFALFVLVVEKIGENRSIPSIGLLPAMRAFANCVFQIGPEFPDGGVAVVDVTGQTMGARLREVGAGRGHVFELLAISSQQLKCETCAEQALEGIGIDAQFSGQGGDRLAATCQCVKDSQRDGRKHGLRPTKGFQEIEDDGWFGKARVFGHWRVSGELFVKWIYPGDRVMYVIRNPLDRHPMKVLTKELWMEVPQRRAIVSIHDEVETLVAESGVRDGLCLVNAMHITASVFINDNESGLHRTTRNGSKSSHPLKPRRRRISTIAQGR